jgi:hypothetical protein
MSTVGYFSLSSQSSPVMLCTYAKIMSYNIIQGYQQRTKVTSEIFDTMEVVVLPSLVSFG